MNAFLSQNCTANLLLRMCHEDGKTRGNKGMTLKGKRKKGKAIFSLFKEERNSISSLISRMCHEDEKNKGKQGKREKKGRERR